MIKKINLHSSRLTKPANLVLSSVFGIYSFFCIVLWKRRPE